MILKWTEAERLSFADLLEGLSDEQWDAPSLCAGWTVRHVPAHLTVVATDADWTSGTGTDELRAPVSDLLLLATGRPIPPETQ
jgi:hypothetical protein